MNRRIFFTCSSRSGQIRRTSASDSTTRLPSGRWVERRRAGPASATGSAVGGGPREVRAEARSGAQARPGTRRVQGPSALGAAKAECGAFSGPTLRAATRAGVRGSRCRPATALDARVDRDGLRARGSRLLPRKKQARTDQLEQQPWCGGSPHLGQPGGDDVGGADQLGLAEVGGLATSRCRLVLGRIDQAGGGGVGHRGDDDEVTKPAQDVLGNRRGSWPVSITCRRLRRRPRRRQRRMRRRPCRAGCRGCSGEVGGDVVRHPSGPAPPAWSSTERESRAEAAPRSYDEGRRCRVDRTPSLLAQLGEVVGQRARRDQPEGVVVGRERMDGMTFSGPVVAKMKFRCSGGSSTS